MGYPKPNLLNLQGLFGHGTLVYCHRKVSVSAHGIGLTRSAASQPGSAH